MGDIFGIFRVEGRAYIQDANWVTHIFLWGGHILFEGAYISGVY